VHVKPGQAIVWQNMDQDPHTVTSGEAFTAGTGGATSGVSTTVEPAGWAGSLATDIHVQRLTRFNGDRGHYAPATSGIASVPCPVTGTGRSADIDLDRRHVSWYFERLLFTGI
jgi:hypothetical protein